MDALLVAFLVSGTALISVGLGVFGSYYAITGLLAAVNPNRPAPVVRTLVASSSQAGGD